jgi:iron complex outermembrane receptor protein
VARSSPAHPVKATQRLFICVLALSVLARPGVAAEAAPHEIVSAEPAPSDEVVVTVVRSTPVTASATHVSARAFSFIPRRTAEDALELVPGLTLVQHGSEGKGHQFFLRGFDAVHGADLALDVEGIPINEWSNIHAQGYIDLGFVIPEVVAAVDVVKGPFSVDQGAFAMAGSARYTLGVPLTELGLRTGLTAGTTGRLRGVMTYSPSDGDGSSFVAGEALHDEGFGQNRGIDRAALLAKGALLDSERLGKLTAIGALYLARFELPGALRAEDIERGLVGFRDSYDHGAGGSSARVLASVSYERQWQDHALRASAFGGYRRLGLIENFTGYLLDPVSGDRRDQRQRTWSYGTDVNLSLGLAPVLRLNTGLGLRADTFEQRQDHVGQSAEPLDRERDLAGHQALFSARAGVELRLLAGLEVSAGVRADVVRVAAVDALDGSAPSGASGSLGSLSPRVSVDAALTEAWTLFGAYGRGLRPPEARAFSSFEPARTGLADDLYTGGEPAMTSTDSFELGARLTQGRLGASLAGFATFIERESVYDHVSGVNLELNGTRRIGAELDLDFRWFDWLSLGAFGTFVDARFVASDNPVPLAPRQTAGLTVMAGRMLGPRAGLRLLQIAPRPLPHGAIGATLLSLDAILGWYWQGLHVDLEVENVLNRALREGEYHYASAWNAGQAPSQLPVLELVAGPPLNVRAGVTSWF